MKTDREAAARLANLEYEIVAAIASLDLLADKVLACRGALHSGKALLARSRLLSLRGQLEQVLVDLDEPITQLVLAAEGAADDVPTTF